MTEAHGPLGKPLDAVYCEGAIGDGGVASFDLELKTASGSAIWLNVSVLVFEPLRFSPALIVHLAHDITASRRRRALYDRLRETAREIMELGDEEEHHLVPVPVLTQQEQRLLSLFAQGKTPAQAAKELDISSQTLRNHLYHVNQKLGTHNRLEAVIRGSSRTDLNRLVVDSSVICRSVREGTTLPLPLDEEPHESGEAMVVARSLHSTHVLPPGRKTP